MYDVSVDTLYRAVRARMRPRALRRSDCRSPRKLPQAEMERYCELIAANPNACRGHELARGERRELESEVHGRSGIRDPLDRVKGVPEHRPYCCSPFP